jgi:hypothetical protein
VKQSPHGEFRRGVARAVSLHNATNCIVCCPRHVAIVRS